MVLCIGCSQRAFNAVSYASDDMYGTLSESYLEQRELARLEAEKIEAEQRRAEWSNQLGFASGTVVEFDPKIYDTPYGRRLMALSSSEYNRPDSYYTLAYRESVLDALQSYDPAIYDATVDSDGVVVVEPKYSSSIYGVWSAPLPYYYGYYPSYGYPYWGYYSSWGYDNYLFGMGWGAGLYYDPFYSPFWGIYSRPIPPPILRPSYAYSRSVPKVVKTPQGYSTGKRLSNGATVGTSTRSTTINRGFSTGGTTTRSSTPSVPSSSGGGGGTNALGR